MLEASRIETFRNGEPAVNVAIIGGSGYAETLLDSLCPCLEAANGHLAAATLAGNDADSRASRRLSATGCDIFSDYQEMLRVFEGKLSLCVIPTGIHWHTRMSVDALSAGANVLVEKPLAGNVSDALKISKAARRTGKFVAVGFQDMFCPTTHSIKEYLCSGKLGAVRTIAAEGSWPRTQWYYTRNDWAGKKAKDGWAVWDSPLNNAFAHFLNLALYFAAETPPGLADVKSCDGELLRHFPIETFDTARVKLRTANGVEIRCDFTHFDAAIRDPRLSIQCENGSLLWEFDKRATAFDRRGTEVRRWTLAGAEELRQGMLRNILSCLHDGGQPLFTANDALAHLRAVTFVVNHLRIEDAPNIAAESTDLPGRPEPLLANPTRS